MASPSSPVLALVSGLPRHKRAIWPVVVLQAFIDESETAGDVLVLSGYVAPAEAWLRFSDEWQQLLDMSPKWPYFKMRDVMASGSPERIERAGWFYGVIQKHVTAQFNVVVSTRDLKPIVKEMGFPEKEFGNPYGLGYQAMVSAVIQHQREMDLHTPIDFIFDERSEKEKLLAGWSSYLKVIPEDRRALTGSQPIFRDDREFLPLQAADLIAYLVREEYLKTRNITLDTAIKVPWPAKPTRRIPCLTISYGAKEIRGELQRMEREIRRLTRSVYPGIKQTISVSFFCDLSDPE